MNMSQLKLHMYIGNGINFPAIFLIVFFLSLFTKKIDSYILLKSCVKFNVVYSHFATLHSRKDRISLPHERYSYISYYAL